MGQVGGRPATIVVKLNSSQVLAGTQLDGRVYLNVHKESVDCASLNLTVVGCEVTIVDKGKEMNVQNDYTKIESERPRGATIHNFLNISYKLGEMLDGNIPKGHYEFPFQCIIPAGIPSSMKCTNKDHAWCAIRYYVDARLHRHGILKWDVQNRCPFIVYSMPLLHPPTSAYIGPNANRVHVFNCHNRGHVLCGVLLSSNVLIAGAPVGITISIINRSRSAIKAIKVLIRQKALWETQAKNSKRFIAEKKRILLEQTHAVSILSQALQQRMSPLGPDKENQIIDESILYNEIKTCLDDRSGDRSIAFQFNVPADTFETYSGKYVRMSHELKVEIVTDWISSNPVIRKDLVVCRNQPIGRPTVIPPAPLVTQSTVQAPSMQDGALPENWTPIRAAVTVVPEELCMQQVNLDFDDSINTLEDSAIDLQMFNNNLSPMVPVETMDFETIISELKGKFDRVKLFSSWAICHKDGLAKIAPVDVRRLFELFTNVDMQLSVADILVSSLRSISCNHIAHAALGCLPACRLDVVRTLVSQIEIADPQNGPLVVKDCMAPLEFMCIEQYFKVR